MIIAPAIINLTKGYGSCFFNFNCTPLLMRILEHYCRYKAAEGGNKSWFLLFRLIIMHPGLAFFMIYLHKRLFFAFYKLLQTLAIDQNQKKKKNYGTC